MRVGIVVDWRRGEHSQAACRLAEVLGASREVSIASRIWRRLDPKWDRLIRDVSDFKHYRRWATSQNAVIFLYPPDTDEIEGAGKALTIAVAPMMFVGDGDFVQAIKSCRKVVCPTPGTARAWRSIGVKKATVLPWAACLPPLVRDTPGVLKPLVLPGPAKLLLPLHDSNSAHCSAPSVLEMLDRVMDRCAVEVTILHETVKNRSEKAALRALCKNHPGRVTVHSGDPGSFWPSLPVHYAAADLVLWPVDFAGLGYTALDSLAVGTPVACFDCAPQNEFVSAALGEGVYLPAEIGPRGDGLRGPVKIRLPSLARALVSVLKDPVKLAELRRTAENRAESRCREFLSGWRAVLGD